MTNLRDLLTDLKRRGVEIKADPTDSRAFIISPGDKLTPAERQAIDAHPRELLLILHECELDRGIEALVRIRRCRAYSLPSGRVVVVAALATVLWPLRDADDPAVILETLRRFEVALIELGGKIDLKLADATVGEN